MVTWHHCPASDLAVWSPAFADDYFTIIEKVAPLRPTFKNIELHPFNLDDNTETNPFIKKLKKPASLFYRGKNLIFLR